MTITSAVIASSESGFVISVIASLNALAFRRGNLFFAGLFAFYFLYGFILKFSF
jgi:hypothetical protein